WRELGPIGRLRNIIKWINVFPQRRHHFAEIQRRLWRERNPMLPPNVLQLILCVCTRWNSTSVIVSSF
ncbi:hypothetical protein K469DRAFT_584067, partial [Zopfia rhizophila CBS 207.26]